jgi:hypothetical protein
MDNFVQPTVKEVVVPVFVAGTGSGKKGLVINKALQETET